MRDHELDRPFKLKVRRDAGRAYLRGFHRLRTISQPCIRAAGYHLVSVTVTANKNGLRSHSAGGTGGNPWGSCCDLDIPAIALPLANQEQR